MFSKIHVSAYRAWLLCALVFATLCTCDAQAGDMGWAEIRTRLLPDECFAAIEQDAGGRRSRRCPHHDINGELDIDQLVYVLGTIDEEKWVSGAARKEAGEHLQRHYERYLAKTIEETNLFPIDINRAPLCRLVLLPGIGPVLAVRIARQREQNGMFAAPEDIRRVEGIGRGTFRAIRHYISCR